MSQTAREMAEQFLNGEKQFHLGMLPTEQSNPKTRNLDRIFAADPARGIQTLLAVDFDIVPMAKRVFRSREYRQLVDDGLRTLRNGGRLGFSGCGATGRLSILLESMWRQFFIGLRREHPELAAKCGAWDDQVFSIMTGGDFALVKSVESFEDYSIFGRRQAADLAISGRDMLVAITEGGETSSVLGTAAEAADRGAKVYLLFNNPAEVLCRYIERSRQAIEDERITVLDLFCGPMGIAGSTRMQATTSEQLIAGFALEEIILALLGEKLSAAELAALGFDAYEPAAAFEAMVRQISGDGNAAELAGYLKFEADIYAKHGLVTYYAAGHLLDIFTDTTERSPTFMLPPFRKYDETRQVPSWAFVKDPRFSTREAWLRVLGRPPRCLEWRADDYRAMQAPEALAANPPAIGRADLYKFLIGNEPDDCRYERTPNVAVRFNAGSECGQLQEFLTAFEREAAHYQQTKALWVGEPPDAAGADFRIACRSPRSPLHLIERLAVKLVLNTMSTGTMVMLGRVSGNWMSYVQVSNKKLRDRGIRLVAELCGVDYPTACYALHETIEEFGRTDFSNREMPSPVQYTIEKLGRRS